MHVPPSIPPCLPANHLYTLLKWITPAVSVLQLIFVPALSGVSDAIGRRAVIAGAFTLHMAAIVLMAGSPNSLGSVIVCHVVSGLCIVIIPVSQAIMIDVAR